MSITINTGFLKETLKLEGDETARLDERLAHCEAEIEQARTILAGTAIGSLPDDYPLSKLVTEMWNVLQDRTTEGLSLIGRIEAILEIADTGGRRMETAMDACDKIMEHCYSVLLSPLAKGKPPLKLHFTNEWLKKKIEEDPDDMPETVP